MSKGYTVAPWRPIPGTGQSLAVASGSSSTFTNAVGSQTRAIWLNLTAAAAAQAVIRITQAGTAATATLDLMIKWTDPPIVIGCSPGDKVSAFGVTAASTLYLTELTN